MLHEGLSLEVSVLVALLKRNRCAHGRTLYYQRTSMVIQAIQKYNVVDMEECLQSLQTQIQNLPTKYPSKKKKQSRDSPRQPPHEERWVMIRHDDETHTINNKQSQQQEQELRIHNNAHIQKKKEDDLQNQLSQLQTTITKGIPEILSRIQHASSAYICEISRGFFLPFCTVALAALARTRAILMRMGRSGLLKISKLTCQLHNERNNKKEDGTKASSTSAEAHNHTSISQELVDRTMAIFTEHTNRNQQSNLIINHNRDQIRMYLINNNRTHHSQIPTTMPKNVLAETLHDDEEEDGRYPLENDDHEGGKLTDREKNTYDNDADMDLENRLDTKELTPPPPGVAYYDTKTTGEDDIGESVDISTTAAAAATTTGIQSITPTMDDDTLATSTILETKTVSMMTSTTDDLLQQVQSSKKSKKKRDKKHPKQKQREPQQIQKSSDTTTKGAKRRRMIKEEEKLPLLQDSSSSLMDEEKMKSKKEKKTKKKKKKKQSSSSSPKKDIFDEIFG